MPAEETDLITHLLADNRKLRQLYLAEQKKALTERKRRIVAEAKLAAFLSKEVIGRKERNLLHNSCLDHDLSIVNNTHKDILKNDRNSNSIDSSNDDQLAFMHDNIAESDGKINLSHSVMSSEQSTDSLNNKANSAQCSFKLPQNNFEKPGPTKLSKFWLFIDRNGETKSSIPPPLNEIQQKRKDAFIRRSTQRQILIREASVCRKELAAAKRKVAKQLLAGHAVNRNAFKVLSLMDREICAFPPQTMVHETTRRVRKTREFQDKKKRRREEYDAHINRLLAYCYSQAPYKLNR
ncbi:unnamed protein product [Acanthocheilonema viteae]|uniref:ALMS motif domain-containing protein n=1 Tax=Acanthocheilonema viteae TaxID=6277 RepID=A0A498S6L3_ACAVI|nr:unnamed protein product [Acanthocheilonema viteae]